MKKIIWFSAILLGASSLFSLLNPSLIAAEHAAPQIPGITAPDEKPQACVDCHKNYLVKFIRYQFLPIFSSDCQKTQR